MDPQASIETLLKEASRGLKQARTVEELRDVRELASAAMGIAQRRRKAAPELLQQATCLTIEVEQHLGLALRRTDLPKAAPGNQHSSKKLDRSVEPMGPKSLRDLGISKEVSSRSQLFARCAPGELQVWMVDQCQQGKCPTLKAAYLFARQRTRGKTAVKKPLRIPSATPTDDPLDNLDGHHRSLDNLLRDFYDGETARFTPSKGRLMKRIMAEMRQFLLELKTERDKRDK